MRIHAIQTGVVTVKSRQTQGVGKGFRRRLNTLLDASWTDWLPIYCWVIEHPEGLIVVDTGDTASTSDPRYFPRWHPYFRYGVKMRVEPEQEVGPQLRKLGLSPKDVRWVILTHLHTDHAGGISQFARSEFLVSGKEHQLASGLVGQMRGYLPHRLPHWFDPHLLDYVDGEYGPFSKGYTVTKSEDVLIVPTPGHTLGHQSVILRDGDVTYMFAGDTSYTEEFMVDGVIDGISPNLQVAHKTIASIQEFIRLESVIYLPSHDPMSAERMVHQASTT